MDDEFVLGSDIYKNIDVEEDGSSDSDVEADLDMTLTKSAFEQTTEALTRLGAITLDRFLVTDGEDNGGDNSLEDVDVPFVHTRGDAVVSNGGSGGSDGNLANVNIDLATISPSDAPKVLRDLARKLFGGSKSASRADFIKYEVLEEKMPLKGMSPPSLKYSCILTLFRPTGSSRSYRAPKAEYTKRSEAKAASAYLALQLGALDFMKNGDKSRDRIHLVPLGKSGLPGNGESGRTANDEGDGNEDGQPVKRDSSGDLAILSIENCCTEWRSGNVRPQWVYLTDNRFIGSFGCALRISLSAHVQRAYSVVPGGLVSSSSSNTSSFPTKSHAKSACAKLAIEEGVLEFIRHGDGLEQPAPSSGLGMRVDHAEASNPGGVPFAPAATVLTLQSFYDSLPKPMPDSIGTKMNGDFNAIAWLNNIIQMTKGSRMSSSFHWYTDAKVGLHGCLLRLTCPDGPSKTYMVDASFSKRSDAKIAACLWACSQGITAYVQQVAAEIDSHVTPEMRRRSVEEFLPALRRALSKIQPGLKADFDFVCDLASFCCTMTIDLSAITDKANTNDISTEATSSNAPCSTSEPAALDAINNENLKEPSTETTSASTLEHTAPVQPSSETEARSNKIWITRTKFQYKTKQDARIAAICLACEEGVLQWIEEYQNLSSGSVAAGEDKMAVDRAFRSRGTAGSGRGWGSRGRGGFERGYRGQASGRGFGRGGSGFHGGYGYNYSSRSHNNGYGSTEFGRTGADLTKHNRSAPAVGGNSHTELEEGEMIDGKHVLNASSRNDWSLGRAGRGFSRVRGKRGAGGFGLGRGRGGNMATVSPARTTQQIHPHSQVAPHINPRFFPHINGVLASSYPQFQPAPIFQAPTIPPNYDYNAYSYDYNSGVGGEMPVNDYQQWQGEEGGTKASSQYQYNSGYISNIPNEVVRGDQVSPASRYPVNSGNDGVRPVQHQHSATESAHFGRQLDTADAASNAVSEPQLVPSSVGADKARVELGVGEESAVSMQGAERIEKRNEVEGKNVNGVVTLGGKEDEPQKEEGAVHRDTSVPMVAWHTKPTEVIPSGPRNTRNRNRKVDTQFNPSAGPASAGPSNIGPSQHYYPSNVAYSYQQAAPPPVPEFFNSHYGYSHSYQQQPPYQPFQHYDHYYPFEALPLSVPQMPVFNIPGSYSYSGDSAGGYLPPHSPTQPDFYPASVNYSSPQSRVGSGRSGPPSGPRGLPSRKRPVDASSDVQSEGRQPPSAPRAMLEKLGSQEGKPSFAKEKIRINKNANPSSSPGKRSRDNFVSGQDRKRLKTSALS